MTSFFCSSCYDFECKIIYLWTLLTFFSLSIVSLGFKIFSVWPFVRKVYPPLLYIINNICFVTLSISYCNRAEINRVVLSFVFREINAVNRAVHIIRLLFLQQTGFMLTKLLDY